MVLLRTIAAFAFSLFSVLFFFPFGVLAFLLSFLGLKKPTSWLIYNIGRFWAMGVIFISGCAMEIEGRENIPRQGGVCFVSNHVGIFDIVLALAYIGRPFGFIAKKSLLFLPFFDIWIYMLGGLFIDRKNIRNALKTINRGILKIQNGACMLIFPEGTRSKGRGLLPFRSGAVKLATHSLAPIVPIAISGSYEVFEKDHLVRSVPVRVVFCPPINTAEMSDNDRRHNLAPQVRSIIEAAINRWYVDRAL
jgi:1-acyl-sn-glycerol-3-phosphate acyltransferase